MGIKLYKVSVTLTKDGFSEKVKEFDIVKEGQKTYHIQLKDEFETINRFKKKELIGKIDSGIFYNSNERIEFGGWCLEQGIETMKQKAKEGVVKTVKSYFEAIQKLTQHL